MTDFSAVVGNGLTATLAGKMIKAGNLAFVSKFVKVSDDMRAKACVKNGTICMHVMPQAGYAKTVLRIAVAVTVIYSKEMDDNRIFM